MPRAITYWLWKPAALKQAGDFCGHALAKAWASKILKSHETPASRSAGRVSIVRLWYSSSQAVRGTYCCLKCSTAKEYFSFTSVKSSTVTKTWTAKKGWYLLSASFCNITQKKWVSSPVWAHTTHKMRPDPAVNSGLQGDDTHFLVAL